MSLDPVALSKTIAAHGPLIRVVVAEVQGSAPRETGAAMLVWATGQADTIGGGALEYEAAATARAMLGRGDPIHSHHALLGPDLGQCCGGAVTLLFEFWTADKATALGPVHAIPRTPDPGPAPTASPAKPTLTDGWFIEPVAPPATPVWIWGAGHVGRALATTLAPLPGLALTWLDTAPDRFPAAPPQSVTCRATPDLAAALPTAPRDAHHFIVTYSHDFDYALCDAALSHGFASLGLIGSATKWARFRARLAQIGHAPAAIDRIQCPIGDPSLGKAPESIALGAAHALLMVLAQTEAECPAPGERGQTHDRRAADA